MNTRMQSYPVDGSIGQNDEYAAVNVETQDAESMKNDAEINSEKSARSSPVHCALADANDSAPNPSPNVNSCVEEMFEQCYFGTN